MFMTRRNRIPVMCLKTRADFDSKRITCPSTGINVRLGLAEPTKVVFNLKSTWGTYLDGNLKKMNNKKGLKCWREVHNPREV